MNLPELSALELRRLIGTKKISPVELMDACIARIGQYNPAINAITATDFDRARATAKEAEAAVMRGDKLGLLHGLPLGVKDLQDTKDLLTTYGNIGLRGNIPAQDNSLVARLRSAGAIVTAKTNVPDMGAGANSRNAVWGATGNPFNPSLNAGGSSGGSAAALATDLLPICTGSDTGGSLRIPAAMCGVVGMRPSPGTVPNDGRALGWSVISVLGPMGRTVADTAFLMGASIGRDPMDPLAYPVDGSTIWPMRHIDLSNLRIGYTEDFGVCIVGEEYRRVFRKRMQAITPMVECCEPVDLNFAEADRAFDILRAENFVAAFADIWRKNPENLGPNIRANMDIAAAITLADRAWAHLEQSRIMRAFSAATEKYDLILSPVVPVTPFPWTELYAAKVDKHEMKNYYHWLGLTYVVTLATNPTLALPCGRDEHGMPFGLQISGRLYEDGKLMAAAHALEQAFAADPELCRAKPDLSALKVAHPELKSIVTHPPLYDAAPSKAGAPGVV